MTVLLGTLEGLYRAPDGDFDRLERVLEGRSDAYRFDAFDGVFARSDGDLYRSPTDGETWSPIEAPEGDVTAVAAKPDGTALYVGTYPPAGVYRWEFDGPEVPGESRVDPTWRESDDFPEFDPVTRYDPERNGTEVVLEAGGRVHDLATHPDAPSRLVAGLEPHGVFVSDDGGETWDPRRTGLHHDVHDLETCGPDAFFCATGQGLYRTRDAGRSWTRIDTDQTYFEHTYFHGVLVHEGTVYTAAAAGSPGDWDGARGANAVLLESDDFGDSFTHVPYPGGPDEIVLSWAVADGRVLAGTMARDWDEDGTATARVIERRDDGTWRTASAVPAGVISITPA